MSLTYYVVVPFGLDDTGHPIPLEPVEAPNAESARRRVSAHSRYERRRLLRTGDPERRLGDLEVPGLGCLSMSGRQCFTAALPPAARHLLRSGSRR